MTTGPLVWPVTPLQEGLLALARLDTADAYVGQTRVDITGPLDTDAVCAAVTRVTGEHPHLHAGFVLSDDVDPAQFVEETPAEIDVTPADGDLEETVARVAVAARARTWDLEDPPLIRWDLVTGDGAAVLLVTAHHAVLDGWSMPILVREVVRCYADHVGVPCAIEPPRGRYADHLAHVSSLNTAAAQAFWANHLSHLRGSQTQPWWVSDRSGPRRTSSTTAVVPPSSAAAAGVAAAESGLTVAALARVCWAVALEVVTGHPLPYAMTVSTRDPSVPGVEDVIGLTTEAVLVADPLRPGDTVLDAAVTSARRWAKSLPHHHVGVRGIRSALAVAADATSLLSVESAASHPTLSVGESRWRIASVEDDTHHSVAATVTVDGETCAIEVVVDDTRVRAGTGPRLAAAFAAAWESVATGTRITDLDALDEPDRRLLVSAQGRSSRATDTPDLLPTVLDRTCRRHADRVALVEADLSTRRSMTFADLAAQIADRRAALLADLPAESTRPGVVAIALQRSAAPVVAVLATLSAGASALVLDPGLPESRRAAILTEVGADLLLTDTGTVVLHGGERSAAPRQPQPDDVASIVLTSGSTGLPKAVAVSHRALAHHLADHVTALHPDGATEHRQVAHTAAFHFDAQWDALLALFLGHTVHVAAQELYLDPVEIAAYVESERIDYLDLTPTVWSALLAADAFTRWPAVCVLGGEALPADLWRRFAERTRETGLRALNLYGPTEATVDAAWAAVTDHPTPVVGRPTGNTGLLVLDDALRRVPAETPGELYLTGPQLALGYLGRAATTAERFVANPYPRRDASGRILPGDERMYRTGDLARWTQDGLLVLGGRSDAQLSLAGRRVEPGEIEATLDAHPQVTQAAVVLTESVSGRGRLVAVVVPRRGTDLDTADLIGSVLAGCRRELPSALVPAQVVVRDALPLTPNGKLDRAALTAELGRAPASSTAPTPPVHAGTMSPGGSAPRSAPDSDSSHDAEQAGPTDRVGVAGDGVAGEAALDAVLRVLEGVLGTATEHPIGPDDDFYAVGGDSIAAIRVAGRMREAGWTLRGADVLAARTPREMAARAVRLCVSEEFGAEARDPFGLLIAEEWTRLEEHLRGARPDARVVRVLPLTPSQLGIYVDAHRHTPDPYRTSAVLRVTDPGGTLTDAEVERGVAAWFAGHEALRIAVWQDDLPQPVAVVLDTLVPPARFVDATGLDEDEVAALLDRVQREEREREIDAATARLSSWAWVRTDGPSYLVLSVHHLLADGWSTPVLADDLRRHLRGEPAPATDTVHARYLQWWSAQDAAAVEATWRAEFDGLPHPTLLGTDAAPGSRRALAQTTLEPSVLAGVTREAGARGATPATAYQAAWARVLASLTGHDDVAYLLTSSGRSAEVDGIEQGVGMFLTTRPVRARASSPRLLDDIASAVARTEVAAHLGLAGVTRLVGTAADSLLVVENYPRTAPAGGDGPDVEPVTGTDSTPFPVTATVMTAPDGLRLEVEIDPARCDLDPQTVVDAWQHALVTGSVAGSALTRVSPDRAAPPVSVSGTPETPAHRTPAPAVAQTAAPVESDVEPDAGSHAEAQGEGRAAAATAGDRPVPEEPLTDLVDRIRSTMAGLLEQAVDEGTSFFDAGGDSVLVVRLVGALRGVGLKVGIADVFAAPTPAALASRAVPVGERVTSVGTGVHLTPALAWYRRLLADGGSGQALQQIRVLDLPPGTTATAAAHALDRLVDRHDALRLRVDADTLDIRPPGHPVPTDGVTFGSGTPAVTDAVTSADDLAARPPRTAVVDADDLTTRVRVLSGEIDPGAGDLVRAAYLPGRTPRLVLLIHHVAVDAVSWGILTDDLRALVEGRSLPPAPSFAEWTRVQHAATGAARAAVAATPRPTLDPVDLVPAGASLGTTAQAMEVEVRLDARTTSALLGRARDGWRTDVVLAAALTAGRAEALLVEMEGHGRPTGLAPDDPREGSPAANAVGWYTVTWPVVIPPGAPTHRTTPGRTEAPGDAALGLCAADDEAYRRHLARTARVVENARTVGADVALLDAVDEEPREDRQRPQVLLNYLGAVPTGGDELDPVRLEAALGPVEGPVSCPVEINAHLDPAGRLVAVWQVAAPLAAQADSLARAWQETLVRIADVELCDAPAPVHDAVGLDPWELDRITEAGVQAVWPPTPVQRGMIVRATRSDDPYVSVLDLDVRGPLDVEALRHAVESVVEHEPQLRLRVRWTGPDAERPVLVTVPDSRVDWTVTQVAGADPDAAVAELRAHLGRRFDLLTDPCLRVGVVRVGEQRYRIVLANHHVVLDGWSVPLLLEAIWERYAHPGSSTPVPIRHTPFARHVARTAAARESARGTDALERRRARLAGTDAGPVTTAVPGEPVDLAVLEAEHADDELDRIAATYGVTPAVVLTVAWGIVLAARTGRRDAVTGVVVAGRESEEALIGMTTDTVAVHVDLRGPGPAGAADAQARDHVSLATVMTDVSAQLAAAMTEPDVGTAALASALGRGVLFDALLVVENYPTGGTAPNDAGLEVHVLDTEDATEYPLALTVETDAGRARLRLEHDRATVPSTEAEATMTAVSRVLDAMEAVGSTGDLQDAADRREVDAGELLRQAAVPGIAPVRGTPQADPDGEEPPAHLDVVVAAFGEIFGRGVDAEDNFFALGGDSILAMSLVTVCRRRGVRVRAGDVFGAPTPRDLAHRATPLDVGTDRSGTHHSGHDTATRGTVPPDAATTVPADIATGGSGPSAPGRATDLTAPPDRDGTPAPLITLGDADSAALDDLLRTLS